MNNLTFNLGRRHPGNGLTYNFRAYATRRVREDFRKNKALKTGSSEQEKALEFAREQVNVLYRQVIVSKLYPPHVKSVMETLSCWPAQRYQTVQAFL
ncbi:hypothetical protein PPTG_19589 [Phytophthora nicotianae INRA-310]|uniref:Complex 1 LYR protein domain-containing protein n=1 Tax=Phytophthora nicotianae (strain INRA-310) TaxID=761204 RepID=W2PEF8_PHYN3|nr:hypothetical protein PPTG_19589 [Phytophthora nicotianae INRA-310]ETM98374.1 hypothetical protein PPTG_19589 [Phytophthora nicotianae INRA-310]